MPTALLRPGRDLPHRHELSCRRVHGAVTGLLPRLRLLALSTVVGVLCGAASTLFLWSLERATETRQQHGWLPWLLPLGGLAIGLVYERFGQPISRGTSLVLDRAADGGPPIPARMAPMVLLATLATHLFGGSAGREGTAVQMGASLADTLSARLRLDATARHQLLVAGIAGGFGSVFGTPWAGAVFGLEVVTLGRWPWRAAAPAVIAAFVGDLTTRALGIGHAVYPRAPETPFTLWLLGAWLLVAVAIAATTTAFMALTNGLKKVAVARLPRLPVRLFVGGLGVVGLWQLAGTGDFLGLGVPTIERAFVDAALPGGTFAWKVVFTAVTLGFGFLGGEVTPLFFVGAALGNLLAQALGLPLALGAGVGLAAVFAAASNAPLALAVMAVELVGPAIAPHVLLVCLVATWLTGHRGIYGGQRVARDKLLGRHEPPLVLERWPGRW